MISEIPVAEETQEVVQETPVEMVAEKNENISATTAETVANSGKSFETVKRKPGRPKKEIEKVEKPKPPPKPKTKTRTPKENIAPANAPANAPEIIQPEERDARVAPFYGLSSAQLVAELVNRRRLEERQMKQNLYRSFVM
jgi:hypothetical protein